MYMLDNQLYGYCRATVRMYISIPSIYALRTLFMTLIWSFKIVGNLSLNVDQNFMRDEGV